MLQAPQIFIFELLAIDRFPSGTVPASKVASLKHEVSNAAVEFRTLVAEALFSSAKSSKRRQQKIGAMFQKPKGKGTGQKLEKSHET